PPSANPTQLVNPRKLRRYPFRSADRRAAQPAAPDKPVQTKRSDAPLFPPLCRQMWLPYLPLRMNPPKSRNARAPEAYSALITLAVKVARAHRCPLPEPPKHGFQPREIASLSAAHSVAKKRKRWRADQAHLDRESLRRQRHRSEAPRQHERLQSHLGRRHH